MKIFITYDYELFFGDPTGSAEKCIIEPTNLLRAIAQRTGVKFVFFVDTGYLKQLEVFKDQFPKVAHEHKLVKEQITALVAEGHDCQLHIHPHWEDSYHNGEKWIMQTDRYKLVDFSSEDIERITTEYHAVLTRWTGKKIIAFRAGGWCLQPFEKIEQAFKKIGIRLDSTVFPKGKFTAGNYYYDFTNAPDLSKWQFEEDLCIPKKNGFCWEYPIASYKYSPLFFWKLFILGRLQPAQHKPIGDGVPMPSPGLRNQMLTRGMQLSANVDGYFVTKLDHILRQHQTKGFEETVLIGHPKACTLFALNRLEKFIERHKNKHSILTFADIEHTL
jgi:peptidoglycan/xylan/chitin deacetylase (PgdA/CDA1 family)